MAADREASNSARVGPRCTISTSILTGFSVDSTAVNAYRTANSAVASSCAARMGLVPPDSIAYTSRSGMSRLTASSVAHRAASTAQRHPSMPTTTEDGGFESRIEAPLAV